MKPYNLYKLFFLLNALWLLLFSTFSLLSSRDVGFTLLSLGVVFCFAFFGVNSQEKSEFKQRLYVAVIIIMGLILRVMAQRFFQPAQMQDFGRAHLALVNGGGEEFALYYSRFPAWFPFYALTRLVYGVFGASVRYMLFLNYGLYVLSACVIYLSARRLFSFASAFVAVALFVFNPNLIVWSAITTPDHFFIFLFFCLFYCIIRFYETPDKYKFLCLSAVFAAFTDFLKPIGIVFLIAFFCVEIFTKIAERKAAAPLATSANEHGKPHNVTKSTFKQWTVFALVFFAVFGAGHGLVRYGIRRTFDMQTVSSNGMYMAFAWSVDGEGRHTLVPVFEQFDELMEKYDNNQALVMDELSRNAREMFRQANVPSVLWQKARITFGDEGVLGWVMQEPATQGVLGGFLWTGFTAFVFVLMLFSAIGTAVAPLAISANGRDNTHDITKSSDLSHAPATSNKNTTAPLIFLLTTTIGYTLVLLLGVTQARYRILLEPIFALLAAYGIVTLNEKVNNSYGFLKYHGRKIVLPVNEIKQAIDGAFSDVQNIVDFGAGTLFWSEYFEKFNARIYAVDTNLQNIPQNVSPKISLHSDIMEALEILPKGEGEKNAIFMCDVIHHLPPDFWQGILPKIVEIFDIIIIKDIDSAHKLGNFCSSMHDRIINCTNFENVYPLVILAFLKENGFEVEIKKVHKLWYPHFLLIGKRKK
ncbi:MAG: glycosyltransferase family 39 protein [Defluviitaleaceae bacterium]|nr:glycosyltransferase family 39 protein [Defluviitaleaceae bacterium]